MKKRFLALACALVLASAMSMTTLAAGSVTTSSVAESAAPSATLDDPALSTGTQQFSEATIEEFAETTTVSSSVNATISAVSTDTAKAAITQAKAVAGNNAFVATIVDLVVPAGTGQATFTIGCPNVWAGQNVTVLHQKADGSWESITPSNVADNAVTFTLSSYSPIAIVINGTAPKTGDIVMAVAGMAVACLAGTAVFARKAKEN